MNTILVNNVNHSIVNTARSCFDKYKDNKFNQQNIDKYNTFKGIQSKNVLELDDFQRDSNFQECLKNILDIVQRNLHLNLYYYWVHFIEYERGGYQTEHNHAHNEDYSSILYLNTCRGGETYFNINQPVSFSPKKGRMITFPSYINHGGKKTSLWFNNKKILVCGMRVVN